MCETYDENVIAVSRNVETCANWFKNNDFDIIDKERSGRPPAMEENELRKDGKKSWKIIENTLI